MAKPKVVPTAARRPGRCAISKETQGPFLDTGQDIPRFGRLYLSFRWLEPMLRNNEYAKFIPESDVEELETQLEAAYKELEEAEERAADFDALVDAVAPYLPEPEPEVREVEVTKPRTPTEEEIEEWIESRGGDHPAVRRARRLEPGSTEEWYELYGDKAPTQPPPTVTPPPSRESEEEPETAEGPASTYELHDQEVDLDQVLSLNVNEVESYVEGKPEEFQDALARREFYLAEANERSVRKGVLLPLGYWDEDENEPLLPLDEGGEDEDEDESDEDEEE